MLRRFALILHYFFILCMKNVFVKPTQHPLSLAVEENWDIVPNYMYLVAKYIHVYLTLNYHFTSALMNEMDGANCIKDGRNEVLIGMRSN